MTWFSWFPDTAWKGAVLLAAAWIATRALAKQPAALRHLVWSAAFGGLLVMPLLSAATPVRVPVTLGAPPASEPNESRPIHTREELPPTVQLVSNELATNPVAALPPKASVLPAWSVGEWLMALWLFGTAAFGLRLIAGFVAIRRIGRPAAEGDEPLSIALDAASMRAGLRVSPRLVVSDGVTMPCAYGWIRPVVVLPGEARTWSRERLDVVLLHEATHIRRGDYATHLLAEFARVLHWYNPLVWVASRLLRAEAERATDERVMHAGARASDYAGHLLDIVRSASARRVPAPMLPLAHRSEFEGRLIAILEYAGVRRLRTRAAALTVATAAGLVVTVASIGAAPAPVVSSSAGRFTAPQRQVAQSATDSGSTTSALLDAIRDSVPAVRLAVVEALGQSRDTTVVRALMRVLSEDDNAQVRRAAAWSLGEIGDTLAVPSLMDALVRDRDAEVRKNAASALGSLESRRATSALAQAMENDAETPVRIEAANALGQIEDPAAANALTRALGREADPTLKIAIIESIDNLDDERAASALAGALRDRHPGVRTAAAEALSGIEDRSVIPALIAAARDDDVNVRRAVIDALSDFDDRRALDVFATALGDADAEVRAAAANGLSNIEDLRTAPRQLIAALDDPDADVRQQVAHALAHIEDPASLNALIARVQDSNKDVRLAVVEALSEFADASVTAALRTALRDSDAEVRESAARALGDRSRR
jgi:HEAT repeat protein/beta-lactamase regulating signal transducer with metallopeptidase domain